MGVGGWRARAGAPREGQDGVEFLMALCSHVSTAKDVARRELLYYSALYSSDPPPLSACLTLQDVWQGQRVSLRDREFPLSLGANGEVWSSGTLTEEVVRWTRSCGSTSGGQGVASRHRYGRLRRTSLWRSRRVRKEGAFGDVSHLTITSEECVHVACQRVHETSQTQAQGGQGT